MQESNKRNPILIAALCAGAIALSAPARAQIDIGAVTGVRSHPGTPNEVQVKPVSPASVRIQFHNTASSDECLRFEFSTMMNDVVVAPADNPATEFPASPFCTHDKYVTRPLDSLQPETKYCFQVWARRHGDNMRSQQPSAWACATTPPYPPLAPLDVKAFMTSVAASSPPRLSWNTPDQSNHRGIVRFTVERQTSPGPNRPWVSEGAVNGPAGDQSASARLAFSFTASVIDPKVPQIYRVCAENDGGRTCAAPVALEVKAPEIAKGVSLNDPIASATAASNRSGFSSLSPQTKASVLAAVTAAPQPARPTTPRPGQPPSSAPSQSAAAGSAPSNSPITSTLSPQAKAAVIGAVAAAPTTTSSGSVSSPGGGGGGKSGIAAPPTMASPAPVALAALVRKSDLPRNLPHSDDNAIIIVGGTQARAGDVKQEVLKLDDNAIIIVGGHRVRASHLKRELSRPARARNWADVPGSDAALNPQPLPPKGSAQTKTNSQFSAPGSALKQ